MKRILSFAPLAVFCMILNSPATAQLADTPRSMPLYTGEIPNSRPVPDEEQSSVTPEGVRVISKITKPTLTMYAPPAGSANGAAVIICPGGGYWVEAAGLEGSDFAARFVQSGVTAFVLKYRIPDEKTMIDRSIGALQDAQQAIRLVREQAAKWGLDPHRIGLMGFSAGGHLASTEATHFQHAYIPNPNGTSLRPDFLILGYPVITCQGPLRHSGSCEQLIGKKPTPEQVRNFSNEQQVTDATPPTFLVHASDDEGVPPQNSILFYEALLAHHVPAEMHLYEHSGHGFGLHLKDTQEDWMGRCIHWMEQNKWLPIPKDVISQKSK
jgi:acetyl esterase/lipase